MGGRLDCDWWDLNRPVLDAVDQSKPVRSHKLANGVTAIEHSLTVPTLAELTGLDADVVTWALFDMHPTHLIVTVDPEPVVRARLLTPNNQYPEDHPLGGTIENPASVEALLEMSGVTRGSESVQEHRARRLTVLREWAATYPIDPDSRIAGELRYLRILPRLTRPAHPLPVVPEPTTPGTFTAGDAIRLANVAGRDRTIRTRANPLSTRADTILRILTQADPGALPGPVGLLVAGVPVRVVARLLPG